MERAEQGEAPSEEEKHATLQYVMYTLEPHLFTELLAELPFSSALFEEGIMHTENEIKDSERRGTLIPLRSL